MSYSNTEYPAFSQFAHGANRSTTRGPQFSDRNTDIDKLIPSHDRKALVSISSRLFTNMGIPKAAIRQKADFSIGEAWLPTYTGPSDLEDGKAIAVFLRKVWFPSCDVRGGIFDWWKLLELTSIALDVGGDVFWLKVKGEDNFPRIQQIPTHRVDSCGYGQKVESGLFKGLRIKDGIIYYPGGRPAGYRVITGDDSREFTDYPASEIIHIFDPTYQEQGRGLPAFTHAIEDLKHTLCSTEDERIRQMIISRLHLIEYNETGGPDMNDPKNALETVQEATDDNPEVKVIIEKQEGGKVYMKAGSGAKLEQVKHESPGEIWENFHNRLQGIALDGFGWTKILLSMPSGQGTAERVGVLKARRAVTQRQRLLRHAARLAISWAYSVFQQNKRVPLLDHPLSWAFTMPPRLTVDDGREASAMRDNFRMGSVNMADLLEAEGKTYEDHIDQRIAEVVTRETKRLDAMAKNPGIVIDPRDIVMLTPNEMPQQAQTQNNQPEEDEE